MRVQSVFLRSKMTMAFNGNYCLERTYIHIIRQTSHKYHLIEFKYRRTIALHKFDFFMLLLLLLLDTQIPTWALFCSTFIAVYAGYKLAMCLSSLFILLHCIHFCFRKYAHQPIQMPNQFVIFFFLQIKR